jgi:hypothetical protein
LPASTSRSRFRPEGGVTSALLNSRGRGAPALSFHRGEKEVRMAEKEEDRGRGRGAGVVPLRHVPHRTGERARDARLHLRQDAPLSHSDQPGRSREGELSPYDLTRGRIVYRNK